MNLYLQKNKNHFLILLRYEAGKFASGEHCNTYAWGRVRSGIEVMSTFLQDSLETTVLSKRFLKLSLRNQTTYRTDRSF